ncbi:hypothetical protein [Cryptosporangium aurantiacum]|uniref:Uncharacterized protein n=1 Tax=Cryptosporangium aurantiacum TaxID=134849 RepID=A0A1M7RN02_9ACTN|nr:hypothetical protein [Cryptosporangium aurantiacum]SHN47624.1 hypothetical protein SAMN05443668_1266 [Cryptosporangium aurantiacum]
MAAATPSGSDASTTAPRVERRYLPWLVLGWALAYGTVQLTWAIIGAPSFEPLGTDLMVFAGWASVGLCAAVAATAVGLIRARSWRPALAVAGWGTAVALVLACPLLLLDVVGLLFPGLGLPFDLAAFLSRSAALTGAVLEGLALRRYQRLFRGDCRRCGRTGNPRSAESAVHVPRWAWAAAYLAVAGCLIRLAAQLAVGPGNTPLAEGPSMVAFEIGFLLAGIVLPLALVHSWGRVWPRWVPLLAGRRVPRLLLLGPAVAISGGLIVYFGVGLVQLSVETITGTWDPGDGALPLWFYWIAIPAYLLWGIGLLVATVAFQRRTRRPCPACGR